jgi:SAM-dependent methyltransferase
MNTESVHKLRCPVSGERLRLEGGVLQSESGKFQYPLHAGQIPLFADEFCSKDALRQREHYDHVAGLYLENLAYPHTEEYNAYLDRVFLDIVSAGPLGSCVELCCGQGEALSLMAERIEDGIGLDISVSMLEAAAANPRLKRFTFIQGDATILPLPDGSVDRVFMFGGIHHVSDRRGLFGEINRVLRPGGEFYFREPVSDFFLWSWLRAIIYRFSPNLDHETERPLLLEETQPPLQSAGLRLEHWQTCGFLGFCLLMNSDVLVFNRLFRFVPGIRALTRWITKFDDMILSWPFMRNTGLQVVGRAVKPKRSD